MSDHCPTCGSSDWVPIYYGYPSPAMYAGVHLGVIQLGGCIVSLESPRRACLNCSTRWHETDPFAAETSVPEPVSRAREVIESLPPEVLERFDCIGCSQCGGTMRRSGPSYMCESCGRDTSSSP